MDKFWKVSAQKYLTEVFFRREIDDKANNGDAFAAAVIATAAARPMKTPMWPGKEAENGGE